jgi:hypothetical protein
MAKSKTKLAEAVRSRYSVHPSLAMEASSLINLVERTGKSLDEWVAIVQASGPPGQKERQAWLKAEHGFTTNYALWVAGRASGERTAETYDPDALVAAMFAGPKAGLVPIYDRLLDLGLGLGADVKACPCQTMVPFYRTHVFAQIKPTTRTRIDLGLALKDAPATGRLIDTGGYAKKDRITHRIPIERLEEIDDAVVRWLRKAYELDAPR